MSMAFNDTRSAGPKSGRQVFLQIVQLRVVAAVYYLCLLVATSRALHWYKPEDSLESWVHLWVRFTRQNLITGFTLLLAIALVEAWLQHRKHAGPALRWRGLALGLAAPVSVLLRHVIGRLDNPEAVFKWSWGVFHLPALDHDRRGGLCPAALHPQAPGFAPTTGRQCPRTRASEGATAGGPAERLAGADRTSFPVQHPGPCQTPVRDRTGTRP